jgi:mono/diheme cytochrome c family protein
MKRDLFLLFFGLIAFPLVLSAQPQSNAANTLNDQQTTGRQVFRQRCAVCHLPPVPGARVYGPSLYKELIAGNEDAIRGFIMNGSKGKMPGFKYGLARTEIDAIVEYLKTVDKTAPKKPGNAEGVIVND